MAFNSITTPTRQYQYYPMFQYSHPLSQSGMNALVNLWIYDVAGVRFVILGQPNIKNVIQIQSGAFHIIQTLAMYGMIHDLFNIMVFEYNPPKRFRAESFRRVEMTIDYERNMIHSLVWLQSSRKEVESFIQATACVEMAVI
mgnify:CR=1 FL=1